MEMIYPLKSACIDLIWNAHLDVHSKVNGVGEDLMNDLITILINDLIYYNEIKQGNHSYWFKTQSDKNPLLDVSINFSLKN